MRKEPRLETSILPENLAYVKTSEIQLFAF